VTTRRTPRPKDEFFERVNPDNLLDESKDAGEYNGRNITTVRLLEVLPSAPAVSLIASAFLGLSQNLAFANDRMLL